MTRLMTAIGRAREYVNAPIVDRLDDAALYRGLETFARRELTRETPLAAAEWRVFSQFGEDGILDHLFRHLPDAPSTFVEFGVESYAESNTRFLCESGGWRGLVLDGGSAHLQFARRRRLHHRGLTTVQHFLTKDNINDVIAGAGFTGEIGLLSVDVDGVDYWLLDALEVVRPSVLVVEYNAYFGAQRAVSVPYDPTFSRRKKSPSGMYFGASLPAFDDLCRERGYRLVGTTSQGLNAFFVDSRLDVPATWTSGDEAYTAPTFSPMVLPDGRPVATLSPADALEPVRSLPLVDTRMGGQLQVADLIAELAATGVRGSPAPAS